MPKSMKGGTVAEFRVSVTGYISEGGFTPTGDISSLRTLTGLGQRSWVVVVQWPWTVPPPTKIIKIIKNNKKYKNMIGN